MKILLFVAIVACSQGFLLDDLFGSLGGCKSDAECTSGCCMTDLFGDSSCVHRYLGYLQECRLDGHERRSCGCGDGLYCESYANVHGAAVETQHFGSTEYGLCEHKVNMSTPGY
uniref:Uncharacterized protein LOC111128720 n=1 Tax=Crassostrea virginica TaxID=6565 RepID=A0A8B8DQW3_CRAVI|nr:uncharacterized protein LOC111128720 [Crassostrea virginica]